MKINGNDIDQVWFGHTIDGRKWPMIIIFKNSHAAKSAYAFMRPPADLLAINGQPDMGIGLETTGILT